MCLLGTESQCDECGEPRLRIVKKDREYKQEPNAGFVGHGKKFEKNNGKPRSNLRQKLGFSSIV